MIQVDQQLFADWISTFINDFDFQDGLDFHKIIKPHHNTNKQLNTLTVFPHYATIQV